MWEISHHWHCDVILSRCGVFRFSKCRLEFAQRELLHICLVVLVSIYRVFVFFSNFARWERNVSEIFMSLLALLYCSPRMLTFSSGKLISALPLCMSGDTPCVLFSFFMTFTFCHSSLLVMFLLIPEHSSSASMLSAPSSPPPCIHFSLWCMIRIWVSWKDSFFRASSLSLFFVWHSCVI